MKPIGYWVKQLDQLIDAGFDDLLGRDGLTRRHWQVLNVLAGGGATQASLREALAPFLTEPGATLDPVLDDLRGRGWLDELELTGDGRSALADLTGRVAAYRVAITNGVTDAEYLTTVETLKRMCANLQ